DPKRVYAPRKPGSSASPRAAAALARSSSASIFGIAVKTGPHRSGRCFLRMVMPMWKTTTPSSWAWVRVRYMVIPLDSLGIQYWLVLLSKARGEATLRISQLSTETGVPVATLKYYLREGLLPQGRVITRTSAEYDEEHVERVRLVRALTAVGGLDLATTRRVLAVVDEPHASRADVLGAAQRALLGEDFVGEPPSSEGFTPSSRAGRWLAATGWQVHPLDPVIDELE